MSEKVLTVIQLTNSINVQLIHYPTLLFTHNNSDNPERYVAPLPGFLGLHSYGKWNETANLPHGQITLHYYIG